MHFLTILTAIWVGVLGSGVTVRDNSILSESCVYHSHVQKKWWIVYSRQSGCLAHLCYLIKLPENSCTGIKKWTMCFRRDYMSKLAHSFRLFLLISMSGCNLFNVLLLVSTCLEIWKDCLDFTISSADLISRENNILVRAYHPWHEIVILISMSIFSTV
jgi:hypothetical protein